MKDKEVRPELWINPIDKHGEPVDATVMEIAKRAWPAVIAIGRERRMYEVSWLREIMEKVVHATSMRLKKDEGVMINTGVTPMELFTWEPIRGCVVGKCWQLAFAMWTGKAKNCW